MFQLRSLRKISKLNVTTSIVRCRHDYVPFEKRVKQECIRLSKLPFVSSLVQSYENVQPLKNYKILNIQHQLGDVAAQTEALIGLGASPSELYFLPPSYTHHKDFEQFVEKYLQIPKENLFSSSAYRLKYNYDQFRLVQVIHGLKKLIEMESKKGRESIKQLLILDDGGCFSESLAVLLDIEKGSIDAQFLTSNFPTKYQMKNSDAKTLLSSIRSIDIRLVEQTSRGLFKYLDDQRIPRALKQLGIFMIDVASSEPKKRLEPSLIAEATIQMLSYLFHEAPDHLKIQKPLDMQRCLLLGYGAIGKAIADALTGDNELGYFPKSALEVFDKDQDKNLAAINDGYQIFERWEQNGQFDYIIGCAGRCSLPVTSLSLLRDQAYLISASSAAVEFPFYRMVESIHSDQSETRFDLVRDKSQINPLEDENIHRNITFRTNHDSVFTVVNGGMPVTFIGLLNPTYPEKFDLTVGCMIAASIQATQHPHQLDDSNRIRPLDSKFSERICRWFDRI